MLLAEVVAKTGEAAKSGPIGLAVILILCILCYFLFKSMSKHLRKVREEFPGGQAAPDSAAKPKDSAAQLNDSAAEPNDSASEPKDSAAAQSPVQTRAEPPTKG